VSNWARRKQVFEGETDGGDDIRRGASSEALDQHCAVINLADGQGWRTVIMGWASCDPTRWPGGAYLMQTVQQWRGTHLCGAFLRFADSLLNPRQHK